MLELLGFAVAVGLVFYYTARLAKPVDDKDPYETEFEEWLDSLKEKNDE